MASSNSIGALESFEYLADNVPTWLTKLDDLTAQVAEQNARFIQLTKESPQPMSKKKNNSTESLRPHEANVPNEKTKNETAKMLPPPADPEPTYVPPNPSHKCISHASRRNANAQQHTPSPLAPTGTRKRKPTSTHQSAASVHAHPRYRTRSTIVVYYDSAIQGALDHMVKLIATARNNLRKGKSSASFKIRMASMGMGPNRPIPGSTNDLLIPSPKVMKGGIGRSVGLGLRDSSTNEKLKNFEEADRELEIAQNLCEVAAHQVLRDGDCRVEIEGIRKRFNSSHIVAKREVEKLRLEEKREKEAERQAEKKNGTDSIEDDKPQLVTDIPSPKAMAPEPIKQMNVTGTGTIEIDDESDPESVHIDLSAIRRTRRV